MSKLSLVVLVLLNAILSVRLEPSFCPKIELVKDFTVAKYVGKWFEIERYPAVFQDETKCSHSELTLNSDKSIGIVNTAIIPSIDEIIIQRAQAIQNPSNPANLTVQMDKMPHKNIYYVLDTDYTTYALVYTCRNSDHLGEAVRFEFAWIYSRTPTLDKKIVDQLKGKLEAMNSTVSNFEPTDQTECNFDEGTDEEEVTEKSNE